MKHSINRSGIRDADAVQRMKKREDEFLESMMSWSEKY
jgi:hypothetical protein